MPYIVFGSEERKPSKALDTDVLKVLLESTDADALQSASTFLAKAAKIKKS